MVNGRQVAALRIGIVHVDIPAQDQPALVGLADIEMPGAVGHHMIDHRFDRFADESL